MAIRTWIFDLDDTLHRASAGIFPRINQMMTDFMMHYLSVDEHEATKLRQRYWAQYGATLKGLMTHHNIDPYFFLKETHPLPVLEQALEWEHGLASWLKQLPGRKILLSNGPQHYVEGLLHRMQIRRHFHSTYGIERLNLIPKPYTHAFRTVLRSQRLRAEHCIMVEDSLANLQTAKRLGMTTVWISTSTKRPSYVDYKIRSIRDLLKLSLTQRSL